MQIPKSIDGYSKRQFSFAPFACGKSETETKFNLVLKNLIAFFAISISFLPLNSFSEQIDPNRGEAFLGNANAKVTLIEYGSLTCSHCAELATQTMPEIKKKYIDTGKVKFVYRSMPTQPASLAIGLQVIADCAGGTKKYEIIDEFYRNQDQIFQAANSPNGALRYALKLAKDKTGLDENKAKKCLQDSKMIDKVMEVSEFGTKKYKVSSTPSLLINGKNIDPAGTTPFTIQFISSQIDKALNTKPAKAKKK